MTGSLPWTPTAQVPPTMNNPAEMLQRIERNTADMLRWVKILVVVMIVTLVLDALIIV